MGVTPQLLLYTYVYRYKNIWKGFNEIAVKVYSENKTQKVKAKLPHIWCVTKAFICFGGPDEGGSTQNKVRNTVIQA